MRVEQLGGEGRVVGAAALHQAGRRLGAARIGVLGQQVFSTSITASARDGGQPSCSASFLAV